MQHSVIYREGELLFYRCSEMSYPSAPKGTYAFNLEIGTFQKNSKVYQILKEDANKYLQTLNDGQKNMLVNGGVKVDYTHIEIFEIEGKQYARYNENGGNIKGVASKPETIKPSTTITTNMPTMKIEATENKKFFFELMIDDDNGEPIMEFNFDNFTDTIEKKLLKAFVIKAKMNGIELHDNKGTKQQIKIKKIG